MIKKSAISAKFVTFKGVCRIYNYFQVCPCGPGQILAKYVWDKKGGMTHPNGSYSIFCCIQNICYLLSILPMPNTSVNSIEKVIGRFVWVSSGFKEFIWKKWRSEDHKSIGHFGYWIKFGHRCFRVECGSVRWLSEVQVQKRSPWCKVAFKPTNLKTKEISADGKTLTQSSIKGFLTNNKGGNEPQGCKRKKTGWNFETQQKVEGRNNGQTEKNP